jgi:SAM-dependent methyltransferase/uncharacterized protein YbaR (Trm112 family)
LSDGTAVTAEEALTDLIRCPDCRCRLRDQEGRLSCAGCALDFPVVDGIPILLPHLFSEHGRPPPEGLALKLEQADYYDRSVDTDFEIRRPHGTPRLYRWVIGEKLRRSLAGIRPVVAGCTALTVCGGSGMDAEFLSRAGCRVISSDISLGAAKRAKERARRYGFQLLAIVADAERLPFDDQSIDLVYVHDGLHHLTDPWAGVGEMARVAAQAVSITEPVRAAATRVAIHLGISDEVEDAGNTVARLNPAKVSSLLRGRGFAVLKSERYAMYYPHEPGKGFLNLSRPILFWAVKSAWRLLNATLGHRIGNKLSLVALSEGSLRGTGSASAPARMLEPTRL